MVLLVSKSIYKQLIYKQSCAAFVPILANAKFPSKPHRNEAELIASPRYSKDSGHYPKLSSGVMVCYCIK